MMHCYQRQLLPEFRYQQSGPQVPANARLSPQKKKTHPFVEWQSVVFRKDEIQIFQRLGQEEGLLRVVLGRVDVVDVAYPRKSIWRSAIQFQRLQKRLIFFQSKVSESPREDFVTLPLLASWSVNNTFNLGLTNSKMRLIFMYRICIYNG